MQIDPYRSSIETVKLMQPRCAIYFKVSLFTPVEVEVTLAPRRLCIKFIWSILEASGIMALRNFDEDPPNLGQV